MKITKVQTHNIEIFESYRKKWNIIQKDFVVLWKDGKQISETLYRKGFDGGDFSKEYTTLIKHVEAFYPDGITTDKLRKPHLEDRWCIMNNEGVEKVVFKPFASPYLQGGVIYSLDSYYYNIETGYCYGRASSAIETKTLIYLEVKFDKDVRRRGVVIINKITGDWEMSK